MDASGVGTITRRRAETPRGTLRVAILLERRYRRQPQPFALVSALRSRGHRVTVVQDTRRDARDASLLGELDAVVARGRSDRLLRLLKAARGLGVPVVNDPWGIETVRNKARVAGALGARRIPTPRTYLGPVPQLAGLVEPSDYPVIVKPILGDNARGIRIADTAEQLGRLRWPDPVALAQPYLPSDGYDLKLYGIAGEVWAVRKRSPLRGVARTWKTADAREATEPLRRLASSCAAAFGLLLYGVDCIDTPEGPVVVDVNDFPNYSGVPAAAERLADLVTSIARGEHP